jgi:hypothetical protein
VFGILCAKWRILLKHIETNIDNAIHIVRAICVLHNFLIDENIGAYRPSAMADSESSGSRDAENGAWRSSVTENLESSQTVSPHAVNWTNDAKEIRNILIEYFNSPEGSVPWQDNMI